MTLSQIQLDPQERALSRGDSVVVRGTVTLATDAPETDFQAL